MITKEQLSRLSYGSYQHFKKLEKGPYTGHWAHLAPMMFTVGVMVSNSDDGNPITRWCYHSFVGAFLGLQEWDGVGDPPGDWIKEKGRDGERPNPNSSITCPRCHMTSHNPNDVREGYCGNCHDWTSAGER
jgi:hypothetical protein